MKKIKVHISQKFYLSLFLIKFLVIIIISGCTRYATQNEIFKLRKLEQEVLSLEREVKELKEKQIEMMKYKFRLLKELEDCESLKKSKNSDN